MANIKDLKKRIKSTKSTLKITSAMKLVSAAKLSKAQSKITGIKSYTKELEKTILIATSLNDQYENPLIRENNAEKCAVLVISSYKGLCGSYNSQLYKHFKQFLTSFSHVPVDIYSIGRKVDDLLKRDAKKIKSKFSFKGQEPVYEEVSSLVGNLIALYNSGEYKRVYLVYNSFVSALEFKTITHQLLPLTLSTELKEQTLKEYPFDFIYEPNFKEILDEIIPESLVTSVYTIIMDAIASEHASRMTAMDNATNNSKELIKTLNLKANKMRQAAITTELTEIVSGAESLKS